jgi:hypothetical protein
MNRISSRSNASALLFVSLLTGITAAFAEDPIY